MAQVNKIAIELDDEGALETMRRIDVALTRIDRHLSRYPGWFRKLLGFRGIT